jgi:magnesium transporter
MDAKATAQRLMTMLDEDGPGGLAIAVTALKPADFASAFENLDEEQQRKVLIALPPEVSGNLLENVPPALRDSIMQETDDQHLLAILSQASAGDAVYLLGHLDDERAERLLAAMNNTLREQLSEQYNLSDNSAGRIMNRDVVTLRSFWTAQHAIDFMRQNHADTKQRVLYVVDASAHLVGAIDYRELVLADHSDPVEDLMERNPVATSVTADKEDVARLMQKYDLLSIPVISDSRHIKGIVNIADIVEVVQEAATEDMHKMGGVNRLEAPYLGMPFMQMVQKRVGWLALLFLGGTLTTSVMGHYAGAIQAHVVLALFIPLIIASGGNSGSQATTLVIRSMALGEITLKDWWRVLLRELLSGAVLGLILGSIGFARVLLQPDSATAYGEHFMILAIIILCSLIGIVLWGSIIGAMLPFLLRRLNLDPASASAPLVSTVVDVTGLMVYFSIAQALFSFPGI